MSSSNDFPHDNMNGGPPARRSWRRRPDRGLPDDVARLDLAKTYVELQHRLRPDLARAKLLPPRSPKAYAQMADEFRHRFLGNDAPVFDTPVDADGGKGLGAAYLRYSCDNSNPRSLDQQLKNVLERAARDGVFVPWAYVFADAAVSGTIAARQGYQMAKAAVKLGDEGPQTVYVDEVGRASRDAIEALTLGRLIRANRKRLVGVTDGFDSDQEDSKLKLNMFAMVQEWFVDQLRSKVCRGMSDGFAQGRNLGKAALGYKLAPIADGRVRADDGRSVLAKVIDETEAEYVREAFRLFAVEGWSKGRIARRFNELTVGGVATWNGSMIRQLLTRETYFGVEYYGMTYHRVDPDTGDVTVVRRPRAEWKRRDVPDLRIVPPELEAVTKDRLQACRAAYLKRVGDGKRGASRVSVYPTVLVRPVCGYCGSELYLGRAGKYASFCCPNGSGRKHGCRLRTYKAVGIVERAVVGRLKEAVFTPAFVAALVEKANDYLTVESQRPRGDGSPLRAEIKSLSAKRDRLHQLWEGGDGELDDVLAKLKKYKARLAALQDQLREVEGPVVPLTPVTSADVEALVADLHALLRDDPATAAPILRELTGPVTVTQEKGTATRGATWIAKFTVNLVPVVARLASHRNCPTSGVWEYLNTSGWTMPVPVEVRVGFVPKYELIAAEVKELADGGAELVGIATAVGETYETVRAALDFARTGTRPATKPPGQRTGTRTGPPKYLTLAAEVARLRDKEQLPFPQIAQRLGMGEGTARRAYDHAHKSEVADAVRDGQRPNRGQYVLVSMEKRREIAERLSRGEPAKRIAAAVGCSENTVRRIAGRETE